jgi:hypothetical protein
MMKKIECKKSNNGLEVVFQLINAYLCKITPIKNVYFNLLTTLILIAPINIVGLVSTKNEALHLDNNVLARKINDV